MKKHLRIVFTAIILTFAISASAATETNAQINQILKRMDKRYKKLKSLRATVNYERFNSTLKESDIMEGRAIYMPQKGIVPLLRVDWLKPEESIAIADKQYVIYRPRLQQAFTGSADEVIKQGSSGVNSPLAFINMSKAEIKANYLLKYLGKEKLSNGTKVWHLELTPKTGRNYKKADVWVDNSGMPVQTKITGTNNDTSTVLLSNLKKNARLKESDFQINLPISTKIIKSDASCVFGACKAILKRMDYHYKALKSLRTNVIYEIYDSALKETDKMEGKAIYLPLRGRDPLFRVDWTKPEESLVIVNKQYVIYRPKLKQAYMGSTEKITSTYSGIDGPLAFLNMSKVQLKENYAMKYLGEETLGNSTKTWHLELTPKTAQKYKMAEIWVDGNGMPLQIKVVQDNNDSITVSFTNLEKNVALKGTDFPIKPSPGTKIIKN